MSDRPLPLPDPETAFFWEATARRQLEILRCQTCKTWVHYPKPSCWNCSSGDLKPERVSGRGTVYSYTVTHQDVPGYTAPFAVVIVELEEQAGLRMVSNVVDVPPEDVRIGMPVEVTFQPVAEDVWLPLFKKR
ncbi:MAG: DNA-binding protein [Actinobacteria bacterium]|nr:MAG: DNA-binding protein [Actinomycetota bacterium]TMK79222.1 MAG: DNA-binding protein [Actinomycetota bacterium]